MQSPDEAKNRRAKMKHARIDFEWQENGCGVAGCNRKYASIHINGVGFHVDAIPVVMCDDGTQRTDNGCAVCEADLRDVYALAQPGSPFDTHHIDGEDHVLWLTPFAS